MMSDFHESLFEINLNHLRGNIQFFKERLKPKTKIIAVVKAHAYGHGDIEISKALEKSSIDALWVADFEEGVVLRQNNIKIPIIVANASPKSISQIIKYNLDVVVYNFRMLDELIKIKQKINIHLKFNDIILMFQKELGEKIIGKHSSKHYGRLSIISNFKLQVIKKFLVSPNCFFPKPKILSMVIHFKTLKDRKYDIKNISNLEKVTNVLFSNKRKKINKNIP